MYYVQTMSRVYTYDLEDYDVSRTERGDRRAQQSKAQKNKEQQSKARQSKAQ
jgi:hypothetical protein